ncbi:NlpC/P60 family protein [Ureibacillus composti]|nr:NlpC/P60 family protein [Ureibacillus composti]
MKKRWLLPIFAAFMLFTATPDDQAEAASTDELKDIALQWKGTPYVYGGSSKNGTDCSGFTSKVFAELGVKLNRTSGGQYQQGTSVSKSNLQVGDLVFFNTSGSGVSHVGIYIGNGNMISAATSDGVTIDSINDPYYWGSRYIGAKRVAKLSDAEVKDAAIDFSVYASRAEVGNQLAKALKLDTSSTETGFSDVKSSHKYAGAIAAMKEEGIFTGDSNGKYNPSSPITRAQVALVLVKAFDLKQGDKKKSFSDVPDYAADAVSILASNGITSGIGNGKFGSNDHVTLKQLEVFINRAAALK